MRLWPKNLFCQTKGAGWNNVNFFKSIQGLQHQNWGVGKWKVGTLPRNRRAVGVFQDWPVCQDHPQQVQWFVICVSCLKIEGIYCFVEHCRKAWWPNNRNNIIELQFESWPGSLLCSWVRHLLSVVILVVTVPHSSQEYTFLLWTVRESWQNLGG